MLPQGSHVSSVWVSFTDIRQINSQAVRAVNTGMIILGGGLIKHHICNANLMVRITIIICDTHIVCYILQLLKSDWIIIILSPLQRNGADYAVFVNTAQEFDGSDSGARPDEAVSWGKIKATARPVKVYAEATLVFPLLVAETFAREYQIPPVLRQHTS